MNKILDCSMPEKKAEDEDLTSNAGKVGQPDLSKETARTDLPPAWQVNLYRKIHIGRRTFGAFFYINVPIYLVLLGVFIWFTVAIGQDYADQHANPRAVVSYENNLLQTFPNLLICNSAVNARLDLYGAYLLPPERFFEDDDAEDRRWEQNNVTSFFLEVNRTCSNRPDIWYDCWALSADLPAFISSEPEGNKKAGNCFGANTLTLMLGINSQQYNTRNPVLGAQVYMLRSPHQEGDDYCDINGEQCLTQLATEIAAGTIPAPLDQEAVCASRAGKRVADSVFATSGFGNLISLQRSETEDLQACGSKLIQYEPSTIQARYNPEFLALIPDIIGPNTTLDDVVVELALVEMKFRNQFVRQVSYQSLSFQAMLGSVAGWFGFLSDGWGLVSLLFLAEKLYYNLRPHPWRRWFHRVPEPEVVELNN